MDAEEIGRIALEEAEGCLVRAKVRLSEACEGERHVLHEAMSAVLKERRDDEGLNPQKNIAVQLLMAAMDRTARLTDPEAIAATEIIRRPRDLSLSANVKPDRDTICDLLARTAEVVWNESVSKTTLLLDGPNFQICEVESADGTVRNANFTWTGSVPPRQKQPD